LQACSARSESCDGSQQSRACGGLVPERACWEGGLQACSARRESCDGSQQSRACGGLVPEGACWEGASTEPRGPGRVGRAAGRRAPHAERAVMPHSSPEPAACWFGEGVLGGGQACSARRESCDASQQSRACGGLVPEGACWESASNEARPGRPC
jgi:hypothetical protein